MKSMIGKIRNNVLEFGDERFFVGSYVKIDLRGNPGINFPFLKFGGICQVQGPIMSFNSENETLNINVFDCKHLESPCYDQPRMMTISAFDIANIKSIKKPHHRARRIEHGKTDEMFKRWQQY